MELFWARPDAANNKLAEMIRATFKGIKDKIQVKFIVYLWYCK
jgi:hypothetical protein